MNETIQKLLEPINPEQPCGPDLSNDPRYDELTAIAKGKPEVEIGSVQKPAEPPEWRELCDKSAAYLAQSKHLGVAIMYCCSLVKTGGVDGFRDGLQLVRGWLEQYWATLYPSLDPEDNNDPTQRVNLLGTLTAERGPRGSWLRVVDYLYAAEICRPQGLPPVTFEQLLAARNKLPGALDLAKLSGAIKEAGNELIAARHQSLLDALEAGKAIDQFLANTVGSSNAIGFEVLEKGLQELIALIAPYVAGNTAATGEASADNSSAPGESSISISGSVKSRDDVVRVIDSICSYYEQVEPSSPVPYLLRRAQKMVRMNFVETVQELSLANVDALRPSMGSAVDTPESSS